MERKTRNFDAGSRSSGVTGDGFLIRPYADGDKADFKRLYAAVFREPPWNETWADKEIEGELLGYMAKKTLDFRVAVSKRADGNAEGD